MKKFQPDILCLQETKCSESNVGYWIADYNYEYIPFSCSNHWKKGYAGVSILVKDTHLDKINAVHLQKQSIEQTYMGGRFIAVEFDNFILVDVYVLNSGDKDDYRKKFDIDFMNYIKSLQRYNKNIVIVGDMNVVPTHKDYWGDFVSAKNSMPGLKDYEREGLIDLMSKCDLVDSFRELHPDSKCFSWFSYAGDAFKQNKGWRIDLGLVSRDLMPYIGESMIFSEFGGSDHRPIAINIKDEFFQKDKILY
jgi:exodeoxyribonuclease III